MIRVTFDSSALIAATITKNGVSAAALDLVVEQHELVTSEFIVSEVRRKLITKFDFDGVHAEMVIDYLRSVAVEVVPVELPTKSCRDPEDLPILGTAVAGQSRFLVSVDKDLLDLSKFQGIQIVRPGEFLRLVAAIES